MTIVTADPAVAAGLLKEGALVAFPTETVYGLGADATSDEAVARLFEAKGRPSFNPLIIHVASCAAAASTGCSIRWRTARRSILAGAIDACGAAPGCIAGVAPCHCRSR